MGKFNVDCVHIRFVRDYGDRRFPLDERMSRRFEARTACILNFYS